MAQKWRVPMNWRPLRNFRFEKMSLPARKKRRDRRVLNDCRGKIGKIAQSGSIAPHGVRHMTQIFNGFDIAGLAGKFLLWLLRLSWGFFKQCIAHSKKSEFVIQSKPEMTRHVQRRRRCRFPVRGAFSWSWSFSAHQILRETARAQF